MGLETAAIISAAAAVAGTGLAAVQAFRKPKPPKPALLSDAQKKATDVNDGLSKGQKTSLIETSPQGILSDAPTSRATLLGG